MPTVFERGGFKLKTTCIARWIIICNCLATTLTCQCGRLLDGQLTRQRMKKRNEVLKAELCLNDVQFQSQ